ncbi:MAG TPA: hypothetical protein VEG38_09470 [Acidimicrobiia bacterium]|nr:hypothetical protein [Acidimicrobiia bacterium]
MKSYLREQWDRAAAVVAVAAGALMLVLGWAGVQGKIYPGQQMPYVVSGGLGGIFILGIGAVLWLSADMRDEWRKLDDVDATLLRIETAQAGGTTIKLPAETTVDVDNEADEPLAAQGGRSARR